MRRASDFIYNNEINVKNWKLEDDVNFVEKIHQEIVSRIPLYIKQLIDDALAYHEKNNTNYLHTNMTTHGSYAKFVLNIDPLTVAACTLSMNNKYDHNGGLKHNLDTSRFVIQVPHSSYTIIDSSAHLEGYMIESNAESLEVPFKISRIGVKYYGGTLGHKLNRHDGPALISINKKINKTKYEFYINDNNVSVAVATGKKKIDTDFKVKQEYVKQTGETLKEEYPKYDIETYASSKNLRIRMDMTKVHSLEINDLNKKIAELNKITWDNYTISVCKGTKCIALMLVLKDKVNFDTKKIGRMLDVGLF